tara:strand:+ start:66 stop:335 length:270 start_codon:yes stop_codon:yes gene_type:complete
MKYLLSSIAIIIGITFAAPVFAGPPPPDGCDVYSITDDGERVVSEYGYQNWECQFATFVAKRLVIPSLLVLIVFLIANLLLNRHLAQPK